jgi:hypothetical protein
LTLLSPGGRFAQRDGYQVFEMRVVGSSLRGDDVKNVGIDQVGGRVINLPPHGISFEEISQRGLRIMNLYVTKRLNRRIGIAVHE